VPHPPPPAGWKVWRCLREALGAALLEAVGWPTAPLASGAPTSGGSGIVLQSSNNNLIDCNTISGNADGLTDRARVISGTGNTGSNVTGTPCVR